MKKILNIVQDVEDETNSIILEAKYPVHQVEDTINIILRHLTTLRKYVQENGGFKSKLKVCSSIPQKPFFYC